MWDTRPVELRLHLPPDLVEDIVKVQDSDPEFLGRAIRYALARRTIFHELRDTLVPELTSSRN